MGRGAVLWGEGGRPGVYLSPAQGFQSPCTLTGRQGLDTILNCWLRSVQGTAGPGIMKLGPQQQLPGAQQGGHEPPAGGVHPLQHPLSTVQLPATAEADSTQQQSFCHTAPVYHFRSGQHVESCMSSLQKCMRTTGRSLCTKGTPACHALHPS